MKQQSWMSILGSILKRLLGMVLQLLVFCLWVVTNLLETLLHEFNVSVKKYLWPNKD